MKREGLAERFVDVADEVIGILVEEGNGTTSAEIHYALDLIFWARDGEVSTQWRRNPAKRPTEEEWMQEAVRRVESESHLRQLELTRTMLRQNGNR
jgi:hypothetical protein